MLLKSKLSICIKLFKRLKSNEKFTTCYIKYKLILCYLTGKDSFINFIHKVNNANKMSWRPHDLLYLPYPRTKISRNYLHHREFVTAVIDFVLMLNIFLFRFTKKNCLCHNYKKEKSWIMRYTRRSESETTQKFSKFSSCKNFATTF